jgi:hypothetical protein
MRGCLDHERCVAEANQQEARFVPCYQSVDLLYSAVKPTGHKPVSLRLSGSILIAVSWMG